MTRKKIRQKMISNFIYHIVEKFNKSDIDYKSVIKECKLKEVDDFIFVFCDVKNSSENTINELKISLNQENKYIDLRNALPKIDKKLIKGFIFIYHFSEKENVEKREN